MGSKNERVFLSESEEQIVLLFDQLVMIRQIYSDPTRMCTKEQKQEALLIMGQLQLDVYESVEICKQLILDELSNIEESIHNMKLRSIRVVVFSLTKIKDDDLIEFYLKRIKEIIANIMGIQSLAWQREYLEKREGYISGNSAGTKYLIKSPKELMGRRRAKDV